MSLKGHDTPQTVTEVTSEPIDRKPCAGAVTVMFCTAVLGPFVGDTVQPRTPVHTGQQRGKEWNEAKKEEDESKRWYGGLSKYRTLHHEQRNRNGDATGMTAKDTSDVPGTTVKLV